MEIFDFVKKIHDYSTGEVAFIEFDHTNRRAVVLLSLYGSTIELTSSVIRLIDNKHRTGVPSVFRTFLETYVNLVNLHQDKDYGYRMEASNIEQWLKLYKAARAGENPYLKGFSELPNLGDLINEYEEQLQAYKDNGQGPLSIFDRFRKADLENEYRALYNSLSSDAHSNIRALLDRHLELTGDSYKLVFYKDFEIEEFTTELDCIAVALLDASERIHDIFSSGCIEKFHVLRDELSIITKGYGGK